MTPFAAAVDVLNTASVSSSHVQLHALLTSVQTGPLALVADAAELAALGLYLGGARRLARRGRRWPASATAAFVAGIITVWVAIGSGLASYDEVNVQVHVVQHVLLMMISAPLFALSKPVTLASQASSRARQVQILGIVHSRVVSAVTFPVLSWLLYFGFMYAYFGDRTIYDYSVTHRLFHDATHLLFLAIGFLYWQPLLGTDPSRWRLPYPLKMLLVFIGMPFEAFLGISLNMSSRSIDPINSLSNTHVAGETFWILAMGATALSIGVIALQWYRQLERQTPREDRQADVQAAESRLRAAELGVIPEREGWTVPAWRLAQIERQRAAGSSGGSRRTVPRTATPSDT